jgi:hypothetical protein
MFVDSTILTVFLQTWMFRSAFDSASGLEPADTTNNTDLCWTPFYNDRKPVPHRSWWDEIESLQNHLRRGLSLCEKPVAIQCVTQQGIQTVMSVMYLWILSIPYIALAKGK